MNKLLQKMMSASRYLILLKIIVASTLVFLVWWKFLRTPLQAPASSVREEATQEFEIENARPDRWILINNGLLDTESGKWLSNAYLEDQPRIHGIGYWKAKQTIIVRHDRGQFSCYNLKGKKLPPFPEEEQLPRYRLLTEQLDQVFYSHQGDLWVAELDWEKRAYRHFRQITQVGFFDDRRFPEQVLFQTGQFLFLRMRQRTLQVSLLTGTVEEIKIPLGRFAQVNPSKDCLIATARDQATIIVADFLKEEPFILKPTRPGSITQFRWINHSECLILREGKDIRKFNRETGTIEDLYQVTTNGRINVLGEASPEQEWLVINSSMGPAALQLKPPHTIHRVPTLGGQWLSSHEMIYANAGANSEERGTWIYNLREDSHRRILPIPAVTSHQQFFPLTQLENETLILILNEEVWKLPYGAKSFEKVADLSEKFSAAYLIPEWTPPGIKSSSITESQPTADHD